MNTRAPCKRAQETLCSIGQIRHKSTTRRFPKPVPVNETSSTELTERRNYKDEKPNYKTYGSKIWVYTHLQRNHMVYSLTKTMRNNFSLRQIPFNGKKTVPPALRKDLWHPFCAITFSPSTAITKEASAIGLSSYQKLREFRRRHELEWEQKDYMDDEGKNFLNKRQVGLRLCDQKANSVADMAYVFSRLGLREAASPGGTTKEGEVKKQEGKAQELSIVSRVAKDSIGLIGDGSGAEVNIEWWDIRDAEFAETWSDNVTHTQMNENLQTNNREQGKLWGRGKQRYEEQAAREAAAELAQLEGLESQTVEPRTL